MLHLTREDITQMDKRYRAQLINSLSGFKSVNLIATVNKQTCTNLAVFSSVVHLGASPALVGFVMRPDNVERHTLQNIKTQKEYTINQVDENITIAAHQTSARYLKSDCEFKKTGLTPEYINNFKVPFVKESKLKYALTLKEIIPIQLNGTLFVIGKITDIICQEDVIQDDGYINIEALKTVTLSGMDSYHSTKRLSRLSYAKPDKEPTILNLDGKISIETTDSSTIR